MRRGFKTWAEKEAEGARQLLGLTVLERLPARRFLGQLNAVITTPALIPGMADDDVAQLMDIDPGAWSAITATCGETPVVIVNDAHSRERQESSLHHEAAHLVCRHSPSRILQLAGISIREYDDEAEGEATWLAGCLHIPRRALLSAFRNGADEAGVEEMFVASPEMVRYRRSVTAVDRQLAAHSNGRRP